MVVINDVDAKTFTFNGIPYYKNFTPVVRGDKLQIINTYANAAIDLTEGFPVLYSDFLVDGVSYTNATLLQTALLPILFTRDSLGGGGGGGGGESSEIIPIAYTDQTSTENYLYHTANSAKPFPPTAEVHLRDAWWTPNETNQRIIYMFGGNNPTVAKIQYINYYNNVNGSYAIAPNTDTQGIKTCTIYAVNTANFIPSNVYNAVGSELTLLTTLNFNKHTLNTINEIVLPTATAAYGIVIDVADNYGGTHLGLRRIRFLT